MIAINVLYIDTHQQNNRYVNSPMFSSVKEYVHICAFILKFYLSLECIYLLIYFLKKSICKNEFNKSREIYWMACHYGKLRWKKIFECFLTSDPIFDEPNTCMHHHCIPYLSLITTPSLFHSITPAV